MPFTRPTLSQIIARIESDMSTRLLSNGAVVRRSFLGVLARVFAGAVHMLYGFLQWITKQISPMTADTETLEAHAETWSIVRIPGAAATGTVQFTGIDGSTIPAGTLVQRSDGSEYEVTADATIAASSVSATVAASEIGSQHNAEWGESVALISPVAGVNQAAMVDFPGIAGGVDQESTEQLRARLLQRLRQTPQGGSKSDYERWALEVAGVFQPFVFPLYDYNGNIDSPGHVGITFITENFGIPSEPLRAAVAAHIEELRPVTAMVTTYIPEALQVSFHILISPNTEAVRNAVRAEITGLFQRIGAPDSVVPLSQIREAISIAAGENDHDLIEPSADVLTTKRQYPVPDVNNILFGDL